MPQRIKSIFLKFFINSAIRLEKKIVEAIKVRLLFRNCGALFLDYSSFCVYLLKLTLMGFMQQDTQDSNVSQHPVELLQELQLNLKLVVEFVSQQPLDKTSDLSQI